MPLIAPHRLRDQLADEELKRAERAVQILDEFDKEVKERPQAPRPRFMPRSPRAVRGAAVLLDADKVLDELVHRLSRAAKYIKPRDRPVVTAHARCVAAYIQRPWIENYEHTLVAFADAASARYVDTTIPVQTWDGYELHRPAPLFFSELCCGTNKRKTAQEDDTTVFYDNAGARHEAVLVHVLRDGTKIVQDEAVLRAERAWLGGQRIDRPALQLLATAIGRDAGFDATVVDFVTSTLAAHGVAREYARAVALALATHSAIKTLYHVFYVVSGPLVFLDKSLYGRYAHTFASRIGAQLYAPPSVCFLEYAEMFPEVFANIKIGKERVEKIYSQIVVTRGAVVQRLEKRFALVLDPTRRGRQLPVEDVPRLQIEPYDACARDGYEPWELVPYTVDGATQCYVIAELLDRFAARDYTVPQVPYAEFDPSFVSFVARAYQKTAVTVPLVEDEIEAEHPAATDLVDALVARILELEAAAPQKRVSSLCDYCGKAARRTVSTLGADKDVLRYCSVACLSK